MVTFGVTWTGYVVIRGHQVIGTGQQRSIMVVSPRPERSDPLHAVAELNPPEALADGRLSVRGAPEADQREQAIGFFQAA